MTLECTQYMYSPNSIHHRLCSSMLPWTLKCIQALPRWWNFTFKMHSMYVFPQFNSPQASIILYAHMDSKMHAVMLTNVKSALPHWWHFTFSNAPNVCAPSFQFTTGLASVILHAPMDSKNACSDINKFHISIATLVTLEFQNAPNECVPSIQFSTDLTSIWITLYAPMDSIMHTVM